MSDEPRVRPGRGWYALPVLMVASPGLTLLPGLLSPERIQVSPEWEISAFGTTMRFEFEVLGGVLPLVALNVLLAVPVAVGLMVTRRRNRRHLLALAEARPRSGPTLTVTHVESAPPRGRRQ
ncbi:hypothetical protein Skr01_04610 [Sphaerisporangium krabiense]|uniref:Uncharacterized protein n=1 Tax=Sphaerisporangium krabiense TaxID=763782 RepID=A0A7W8Z773_9ACTN|nr:hypothetical protein [Sphaerisporangium krabiense]MBB5628782.1 hypothetical protein [Sphaerisporangium krabiense]GII60376.1 hypothetical protein Skr01_04610 [Sphaerisporangium krabiense]